MFVIGHWQNLEDGIACDWLLTHHALKSKNNPFF